MRRTRPTLATALAALLLTIVPAAAPAAAASTETLLYEGRTIQRATLPARPVIIDTVSTLAADRVEHSVAGRALGRDDTISRAGTTWVANAQVDLTGYSGTVVLRTKLFTGRYGLRVVDKFFTVAPDAPPPPPLVPPTYTRPGPATTGVPDGRALTPSGPLTITRAGAVIDGLDIAGCVVVAASDVTIRNTRIRCSAPGGLAVRVADGAQRLVVEDSEIDGLGTTDIGVGWSSYTMRRVDVHDVVDGARFGHGVTIEDSWIHDMSRIGTLHPDAVQTTSASNTVIRGNFLDPTDTATGDKQNAAVMLGSETGTRAVRNVLIERNVLGGGNYSVNIRGDVTSEGVVIRDNVFDATARYGPVIAPARVPLSTGNLMANGAPVLLKLTS